MQVVSQSVHSSIRLLRLLLYISLQLHSAVLNDLAEFAVDGLLNLDFFGNDVCRAGLQAVQLGSFAFQHLVVLLFLGLELLRDSL